MQLFATYYPIAAFPLLVPVAIAYSLAGHLWCRLRGQPPLAPLPTPQQVSGRAKVAIVTGSNTGIGYETARSLAVDYGMTVVLACRSRSKGEAAAQKIQREGGTAVFVLLDLSSSESIKTFSNSMREKFNKQVGILVCNAGCNASTNEPVENDRDWLYQVNFLGHFDLTAHLMDVLAPQARIVTVASAMHHFITGNVETVEFWKDCASFSRPASASRYSASKLAAVLFTIELNRRYAGRVQSVAVNPGGVNSDIWRNFPRLVVLLFDLVYLNNRQGCRTSVAAAVADWPSLQRPRSDCVEAVYLQPYRTFFATAPNQPLFPSLEMLGVFGGHEVARPRLSKDGYQSATAMWQASTEITKAEWPEKAK